MELVTLAKGLLQEAAEYAAGYKIGQVTLKQTDRLLWVFEKSARWAVPPPLDQDDRPQPELVRPLPWIFFFMLLITLRLTREAISVVNLFLGKPPVRSADVVMYIQSKRRYVRALKYQGNRNMRARTHNRPNSQQSWMESLRYLVEFTMCFKRQNCYANNNTTHQSNNDEESNHNTKRNLDQNNVNDKTMELLIEKMMVNMNTDSEDDSSYTLTNDQSLKSNSESSDVIEITEPEVLDSMKADVPTSTPLKANNSTQNDTTVAEEALLTQLDDTADFTRVSQELIQHESEANQKIAPPKKQKIGTKILKFFHIKPKIVEKTKEVSANGQAHKNTPKRKKGYPSERRDSDVPIVKITPADEANNNKNYVIRRADKTN